MTAYGSTLSVAEHHAIRAVGFTPVGQVLGSSVWAMAYQGSWQCGYTSWRDLSAQVVEVGPIRDLLRDGWRAVLNRMRSEAAALGGDGVVAVRLSRAPVTGEAGGPVELRAIGTAVRSDGAVRPPRPFLSHLSGQQFGQLVAAGWVPADLVIGIGVTGRHDDWKISQQRATWTNQEVRGWTELVTKARAGARSRAREDCARAGGTTLVAAGVTVQVGEVSCRSGREVTDHIAEATVLGTALAPFRATGPAAPLPMLRLTRRTP